MLNLGFSVGELEGRLAKALGRRCRLTPLNVRCTFPVFRGETPEGETLFVKVGTAEEWRRSVGLLREIGDCGLFARFVTEEPIEMGEYAVFVQEWKSSRIVFPEDMSLKQAKRFGFGCERLSAALQGVRDFTPLEGSPIAPERLYETVRRYAMRHPFAGRLLKCLLDIPENDRRYRQEELRIVHGDFHAKNFGFAGDELSCVYDFDKLTQSLACGDLANALIERFSCLGMSRRKRRHLVEATRFVVSRSSWPQWDFIRVGNVARLWFAARRIEKHPDSAWVALDILRRDRCIRGFVRAVGSAWCAGKGPIGRWLDRRALRRAARARAAVPTGVPPSPHAHLLAEHPLVRVGWGGTRRNCYRIGETGYCVKFYKSPEDYPRENVKPAIRREIEARRFSLEDNSSSAEVACHAAFWMRQDEEIRARLPPVVERVFDPCRGWGILENYYTNPDGTAIIPYEFEIARQPSADVRSEIYLRARKLLEKLAASEAPFYEPGNFHVLVRPDGSVELKIVDFEPMSKMAIPLEAIFPWFRRCKLRRKARRYLKDLRERYGLPEGIDEREAFTSACGCHRPAKMI